jgi:hypothetical protein
MFLFYTLLDGTAPSGYGGTQQIAVDHEEVAVEGSFGESFRSSFSIMM